MVHMDHVSAVLDVDYSPTGKEFVSASFDKSVRIFPVDKGHSRWVILQLCLVLLHLNNPQKFLIPNFAEEFTCSGSGSLILYTTWH